MNKYASRSFVALVILAFSFSSKTARASHIGGGDLNLKLETDQAALAKWQDANVGLTMHWAPVALRRTEIGCSRITLKVTFASGWTSGRGPGTPGKWTNNCQQGETRR